MFKTIDNIILQKNIFTQKNNNFFNMINQPDLYKSIFNELKKYLLSQEIEFNNVSTEEKKYFNKNIVCTNFTISNLLNILNKKDIVYHSKNFDNIKKNKIQKKKNNMKIFC